VPAGNFSASDLQAVLAEYHLSLVETERCSRASEGSFYPALQRLIEGTAAALGRRRVQALLLPRPDADLCPDLQVLAGSERVVGYVEAKPPGTDLERVSRSRQLRRYRKAFPNLLLTDFRRFQLFRNDTLVVSVGSFWADAGAGDGLVPLLSTFLDHAHAGLRSAGALAKALAARTRHLKDMIEILLQEELASEEGRGAGRGSAQRGGPSGDVVGFYRAFSQHLIADLEVSEFADLYAQTLTFGLFAARTRWSGNGFGLGTAASAVPETTGVLRDAFRYISLADPPAEVRWILEDLVEVLRGADVDRMFRQWFHEGRGSDPIVHFYETFLEAYDSETRGRRGVFYTPIPLVSYVVRSVDHLLRKYLKFPLGLADERVRLLDPAAGTLPFLTEAWEVAREAFDRAFGTGGEGAFIEGHLLRNFYGLELMMAPYAVGHVKVDYLLREWDAPLAPGERCRLYLTNALEGSALRQSDLPGMASLTRESREAEAVKKDLEVNVVVGNPPYSGHSANRGGWIDELLRDGYERPGGERDSGYYRVEGEPLGEKNPKWLRDDYVKFLRLAQWKIDRAGEGVVGLVTNHGYLDNPTFRGLRASLLQSFDRLYLLDLHGHGKKGERPPEDRADENVFSIRQGVAVALLVKKPGLSRGVFRADLWGSRREKLDWLASHDVSDTDWTEIAPHRPHFLFARLDPEAEARYEGFVPLPEVFPVRSVGVVTGRDEFALAFERRLLEARIDRFFKWAPGEPVERVWPSLRRTRSWDPETARRRVREDEHWRTRLLPILYRPFDHRWIFYSDAVVERPRRAVMEHMLRGGNLGLVVPRQGRGGGGAFVTRHLAGHKAVSAYDINSLFPLYVAPDPPGTGSLFAGADADPGGGLRSNLGRDLRGRLGRAYGACPSPEEVMGYVYSVLYAPGYRAAYAPLLELDFPRVPWPRERELFRSMAALGGRLIDLHLLRAPDLVPPDVLLEGPKGPMVLDRPVEHHAAERRVMVSAVGHFFSGIPAAVWEYEIGGYQVLRRWLTDRRATTPSLEEIEVFCKIATALARTLALQEEIDRLYPKVERDLLRPGS
jgi:hypothetical protein